MMLRRWDRKGGGGAGGFYGGSAFVVCDVRCAMERASPGCGGLLYYVLLALGTWVFRLRRLVQARREVLVSVEYLQRHLLYFQRKPQRGT